MKAPRNKQFQGNRYASPSGEGEGEAQGGRGPEGEGGKLRSLIGGLNVWNLDFIGILAEIAACRSCPFDP